MCVSRHLYLYSTFNNTDCVKALNSIKLESVQQLESVVCVCLFVNEGFVDTSVFLDLGSKRFYFEKAKNSKNLP